MSETVLKYAMRHINDALKRVAFNQRQAMVDMLVGAIVANLVHARGTDGAVKHLEKVIALLNSAPPIAADATKLGRG